MAISNTQYIGDGVYVSLDGFSLRLTTENDTIFLNPSVWQALRAYVEATLRHADSPTEGGT